MNIVKVSHKPNGVGRSSAMLGIPLTILRDLPEDVTHMTVELLQVDDNWGILYKPIIKEK